MGSNLKEIVSTSPIKKFNDQFVLKGVEALEEGRFKEANKHFNRAIKYDPKNPQLHFLNALTYQLRGSFDDVSHYETAEAGYLISLQFDPRNWLAAYQLGQLKFKQQQFREAQNAFAYGLLLAPDNPEMLQALTVSSYYAQDLETALSSVQKIQEIRYNHPPDLILSAMIYASLGDFNNADVYIDLLKKGRNINGIQVQRVLTRIDDWKRIYQQNPHLKLAQADISDTGMDKNVLGSDASTMGLSDNVSNSGSDSNDSSNNKSLKGVDIPKMTQVDVTIIRSEERRTTDKGINLMNGLQLILTGDLFDYARNRTTTSGNTTTDTEQNNASFKVSLPSGGITYNLNIFNDNDDRNEVLARPTLVALDGKPSTFFSGSVFHVELSGVAGSEGTVTDIPVGIKLSITPKFIDKDNVQITVGAARAFLESRSSQAGFSNFSQVSKTELSANVVMKFEETLVLSGLSEKEDEFLKDGVPLLQDVPGLQYLFSHQDTLEFIKSVLILITPHKPRYTYKDGTEKVSKENPVDKDVSLANLKELKNRPDWFKPAPSLDATFMHLKNGRMFKEFQTGDVKMERWEDPKKLETKIKRTLEFLYY